MSHVPERGHGDSSQAGPLDRKVTRFVELGPQESRQENFVGKGTGTPLNPSYKVEGFSCVNEISWLTRSRSAARLVVFAAVRLAPFRTRGSGIPDMPSSARSSVR